LEEAAFSPFIVGIHSKRVKPEEEYLLPVIVDDVSIVGLRKPRQIETREEAYVGAGCDFHSGQFIVFSEKRTGNFLDAMEGTN
jgi:hypothetical protein